MPEGNLGMKLDMPRWLVYRRIVSTEIDMFEALHVLLPHAALPEWWRVFVHTKREGRSSASVALHSLEG